MYHEVLNFWFQELTPADWWKKSIELDHLIAERFGDLLKQAMQSELSDWRKTPEGALAEVIVLDQFSRNVFRDSPLAFASDPLALALSQNAIANGFDRVLAPDHRVFLYMPFMHSESKVIHERAVELFTDLGIASNLDFELKHKAIIDRFGRYPHRNSLLGRVSSPEELDFLLEPGSSF